MKHFRKFKKAFRKSHRRSNAKRKVGNLARKYYINKLESMPMQKFNINPKIYTFRRSSIDNNSVTKLIANVQWAGAQAFWSQPGGAGISSTGGIMGFGLEDVSGSTQLATLFQKIRVRKITVRITMVDAPTAGLTMPTLYLAKYPSSGLITPSQASLSLMTNVTKYQFSNEHRECVISFYPVLFVPALQNTNVASSTQVVLLEKNSRWIDAQAEYINSSTISVVYGGLIYFFDNVVGSSTATINFEVDTQYKVECRDPY